MEAYGPSQYKPLGTTFISPGLVWAHMIHNRGEFPDGAGHQTALDCVETGIAAAHPERVVKSSVTVEETVLTVGDESYDLSTYERVVIVGGGNAAAQVASVLEAMLGPHLDGGIVVTDGQCETAVVDVRPADHPIPSQASVESTRELCNRASGVGSETLVLAVITGGASACLVAPAAGISLADLRETTRSLLDSGVPIGELNVVRKHLSAVKGGRLARLLAPARVCTLLLSDVVGDDPSVIGSGPLVADETTFGDADAVLTDSDATVPGAVRNRVVGGQQGNHEETPGTDDPAFERVTSHIIGSNMTAVTAARDTAVEQGYNALVLSTRLRGRARNVALSHVAIAEEVAATGNPIEPPAVVLSGGETTVRVTGDGTGGPNQEFALACARDLPPETVVAAVDTDGIDGATDAAGALVDGSFVSDHTAATDALKENNSHPYLADRGAVLRTEPTGTNVNDLRVLVIGTPGD